METEDRLTTGRGKGAMGRGNSGKQGKGLVNEHVGMTHGQQGGDGLGNGGWGWTDEGKGGKSLDNCNRINKN